MRRFTKYPNGYIKADSNSGGFYDRIIPVNFDISKVYSGATTDFGYILSGDDVPEELEVDLTGDMMFNTLPITPTNGYVVRVSNLSELLSWLDNEGIPYKTDKYGLIVGGSDDGRINDNLDFCWLENIEEDGRFSVFSSSCVKSTSGIVRKVRNTTFPRNMEYLSIMTPDYKVIWEGSAYGVEDIPEEYLDLDVIDRYCSEVEEDPIYGESFVVIVNE